MAATYAAPNNPPSQAQPGTVPGEPGAMRAPPTTATATSAASPMTKFTIDASSGEPMPVPTAPFMPTCSVNPAPTAIARR